MASSETNNIILFMKNYNFTTTIAGKIVPITIMNFAPYFCTKIPLGISDTMFPMKNDDSINPCNSCDQSYRTPVKALTSATYRFYLKITWSYIQQWNLFFIRTEIKVVSFCGFKYLIGQINSPFELGGFFAFGTYTICIKINENDTRSEYVIPSRRNSTAPKMYRCGKRKSQLKTIKIKW